MQPTPPPDGLWTDLEAAVPVALLPVRVETRFGTRDVALPDGSSLPVAVLRVRIYPDDVSVLPAETGLWKAERAAGAAFWSAQERQPGEDDESFAHRRVAAWDVLVRQVGSHRARFAAEQTRDGAVAPDRVEDPPAAHLLPDSWVLVGSRAGTPAFVHFVERTPGDPQTGPTRSGADAFDREDALLVAPEDGLRWLTDFAAALAVGMAAEIDLETVEQVQSGARPAVVTDGLESLYVVGVRVPAALGRTAEDEAVGLTDLLTRHAALDRLDLVAQGTATNNLTDRPSGWSNAGDPYAGYHRLVDATAPAATGLDPAVPPLRGGATDGEVLDAALGLDGVAADLGGAGRHEQWLARNMSLLTFPVTFGEVLGELGQRVVGDLERYDLLNDEVTPWAREHAASYVRARGPLPAVRVGRNPYGVLPVMARSGWVRQPEEHPFTERLRELLDTLRWYVDRAARTVPRLGAGGRPEDELAAVLSLGPVPHAGGYRVRRVTGPTLGADMSVFNLGTTTGDEREVARKVAQSGALTAEVRTAATRRLLGLTLGDLVDGTQFERMSLFADKPMRSWVAHTPTGGRGPADYLRGLLGHSIFEILLQEKPSQDLLYLLAERALTMAGERDIFGITKMLNPEGFAKAAATPVEFAGTGTTISAARSNLFTQSVAVLAADPALVPAAVAGLRLTDVVADDARRDALLAALGHDQVAVPVNAYEGTARAVQVLSGLGGTELDDEGYTRLTGEALACASTRLDAWYTSAAAQRLDTLRARRPGGVQLGAWGVLVDVHPQAAPAQDAGPTRWQQHLTEHHLTPPPVLTPRDHVGYQHAPSLQQAVAAGILRAGELAHRGDDSTVASVDLTSRRVRVALDLLEAMAHGQPLGALLGYRLERGLHAAGLHTAVSRLRTAYPQRRVAGAPGEAVTVGADTVVPREVVDGLDVWVNRAGVRAQLGLPAAVEPVLAELDAAVQAVADLLVADGVHQLAAGRAEHAGATFAAIAQGQAPPQVTVAREPRAGITVTHRLVLALDDSGGTSGWDRTAPRALLAPEAELWAEEVLGAASLVDVEVGGAVVGLETLGLSALDVLVESRPGADGSTELAARCTAPVAVVELARAAAEVLVASRPAVPGDLASQQSDDPTVDAGTVRAVPPPTPVQLAPVVTAVRTVLRDLLDAVTALGVVTDGLPASATVDGALLVPLARLGVPGCVQPAGPVPVALAVAAASAADAVRRDVFGLLQQTGPGAVTPVAPVDGTTWEAALAAVGASPTGLDTLTKVVRRIGGEAVVPTIAAPSALGEAVVAGVPAEDVEQWLARTGRVRPGLARLDDLSLFLEAAGRRPPRLTPCHLPATPGLAWLGGPLSEVSSPANEHRRWQRPTEPHSHVVVAGAAALVSAPTLHGLVVDEVSEVLPAPSVTTGLALHYDAPNARAPQSVLLAVHPDPAATWSWQLLHETAAEAVALARIRGVDLDDLVPTGIAEFLPLTYLRDGMPDTTPAHVLTDQPFWLADLVIANRVGKVAF